MQLGNRSRERWGADSGWYIHSRNETESRVLIFSVSCLAVRRSIKVSYCRRLVVAVTLDVESITVHPLWEDFAILVRPDDRQ